MDDLDTTNGKKVRKYCLIRWRWNSASEQGQSAMEAALILSMTVLLLFMIVDLGRAMAVYTTMSAAAQKAARTGSFTTETSEIQTAAREYMTSHFDPASVTIVVQQTSEHTEVTITMNFQPITPIVSSALGGGLPLSNTARARIVGVGG